VVLVVLVAGGCSSGGPAPPGQGTTTQAPLPAGATPSSISTMVCSKEAQRDIAAPLGVTATVTTPTWQDHRYTCRYTYPGGSFTLSVKELSSKKETDAYYASLGRQLGDTGTVNGLGQGAFTTGNGSIVARKDWKVLTVDISGLPPQFGVPPTSAADVAATIADVIMACWRGD
jgi:hypothetical protein